MIVTILIIVFACLALASLAYAVRGQCAAVKTLEQLEARAIPIDLASFHNLVDPEEQIFLQKNLSKVCYRRVQRERVLVSIEYVRAASANAAALIRIGESLRESSEPEISASAARLIAAAIRLRLFSLALIAKLFFYVLFPDSRLSVTDLTSRYSQMTESLGLLCRLTSPASSSRILSAL